jgi:branched-chain amino acid transport system permease protein
MTTYLCHELVLISIFSILAVSLNLLVGYLGLTSMAQAAYYGIGAYTVALMALRLHTPLPVNMLAGALLAGLAAFGVSWCALRLHDDYFVLATFGVQIILFSVFKNWVSLTNGPAGLGGIAQVRVLGFAFDTPPRFLLLAASVAVACFLLVRALVRAPFGRVLKAIREDEVFALGLGKNVRRYKVTASIASAALAAIAGALYAHYISFIDPTSFSVTESILIISMVIIGGTASLTGSVLGAAFLIALPEALKFVNMPETVAAAVRQILLGMSLVVLMIFRPQGALGAYGFKRDQ